LDNSFSVPPYFFTEVDAGAVVLDVGFGVVEVGIITGLTGVPGASVVLKVGAGVLEVDAGAVDEGAGVCAEQALASKVTISSPIVRSATSFILWVFIRPSSSNY
jgi:hypothetical protein